MNPISFPASRRFIPRIAALAIAHAAMADSEPLVDLTQMPREPFAAFEDFEESDPVRLWEARGAFDVAFKGITDEAAQNGTKCFKLDIRFREDGECIWRVPLAVPLEGSMHQTVYFRTGRYHNADLTGVGYTVMLTPTDTYYRRRTTTIRGADLNGDPTEWRASNENFMTPGWPNDSIVSETRGGPISLNVAALVTKHDVGVEMDPILWIKGKAGQRAVVYLDNLRVEGDAPDPVAYRTAVQARYDAAAALFYRQLAEWGERFDTVLDTLGALQDLPAHLLPAKTALEKAAFWQRARLKGIAANRHASWKDLDPVMETLWAAEHSVEGLRKPQEEDASPDLVHFGMRPISNITADPHDLPTIGAIAADLEISACRSETEPACFAVHALGELENLTLEISDLEGPGTIPSAAVDPFILKVWYRSGFYSGDPNGRWLLKELLLKDDDLVRVDTDAQHNYVRSTAEDGTEEYLLCSGPTSENLDGLRPVEPDTLQPVTVPAGTTKLFWLTVRVPDDADGGDYTGDVTLRWSGGRSHRIPLRLTVHDFDLPPSPQIHSVFSRSRLSPNPDPNDVNTEYVSVERYEREIRNQVAHGVLNPNSYDGLKRLRPALEARRRAGVATDKFFCVDLSYHVGLAVKEGEEGRRKLKERIANWLSVLREFGYEEMYVMGKDEARGHYLAAERPAIEAIHEAGAKVWAAATHETTFGIIGDVMDLAVMAGISKPFESKQWHAAGKEVFQYGGPMTEWDHAENYRRNCGLVLWKHDYDGMMHYAYRHGMGHVWNDFDHERRDHSFVLPTIGGLIDTVPWEGVREGIDDTRYAAALVEAIDKAGDSEEAKQAQAFLDEINLSDIMDEVRADIVAWIRLLKS
jgi:hypothetical protein